MEKLTELIEYAEARGHAIYWARFRETSAMSVKLPGGRCAIGIDLTQSDSCADVRTKILHEVGHCETDSFYNFSARCDVRGKCENRADRWAIHHAITPQALDEAVVDGDTEPWQLAERFGVSEDLVKKAVCLYTFGNLDAKEYLPI